MLVGLIPVLIAALTTTAQATDAAHGPTGLRFVVKVEMRPTGKGVAGDPPPSFALPAGSAEIEYVTDGKAVRTTLHGRIGRTTNGTVTLALPGETVRYVLDPEQRSVEVRPAISPQPDPGTFDSTITSTQIFDTIEGHRARKFLVSYRQFAARSDQPGRSRTDAAVQTVEFETWCSTEFRAPAALTSMTNGALSYLAPADAKEFARTCPLAVRSVMRISSSPEFETVATMSSIRRVSPSPELFRVPGDYRKVR